VAASPPAWSFDASMTAYLFQDDGDFAQPSLTASRGALSLEGRFNDVALRSFSGFVGRQFTFGNTWEVAVTPKLGAAVGTIDAIIPALEFTLDAWRVELSSEAQFVIDIHDTREDFFYNWSELSFRTTDWLRLGLATQRTRVFEEPRDVQRGVLVGVTFGRVDGAVYWFNPDSDRQYAVATIAVSFRR
jgi:hypothetical protein